MNRTELYEYVRETQVSMATQQMARELMSSLASPSRLERLDEQTQRIGMGTLGRLPSAVFLDMLDVGTGHSTARPAIYNLHRKLGLSRLEAIRHTAPHVGYAAAAIVTSAESPQ